MLVTRSNRQVGELGRLLLFAVQEQVYDTNDQDADLNEIRIRDHLHHPPSYVVEEERSFGLLPKKGPPAYRILAAPAHIHAPRIL